MKFTPWWVTWLAVLALLFGPPRGGAAEQAVGTIPPPTSVPGSGIGGLGAAIATFREPPFSSFSFLFEMGLGAASGQASKMSSDEHQMILDYQLTVPGANALIASYSQMARYFMSLPAEIRRARTRAAMGKHPTLTETITHLEKDSQRMAICKRNGLTANDFIVGGRALRIALWLAEGRQASPEVFASPANLAFANANLAQLRSTWHGLEPKWDSVEWRRMDQE